MINLDSAFSSSPLEENTGYPNPLHSFYTRDTRNLFQMDNMGREQETVEKNMRNNLNLNLTPTDDSNTITKDVFNLMRADGEISRGELTLVVFLFQHGSVCQLDKGITPTLLDNRLKFSQGQVLHNGDGAFKGTAVADAVGKAVVLENLWVANFASPSAMLWMKNKKMGEELQNIIDGEYGSKCKILEEFLEKGFKDSSNQGTSGPPISQLYKLIDKGTQNHNTGCFDFRVGNTKIVTGDIENEQMGLTKVLCGSQSLGTGERAAHFLFEQEGYSAIPSDKDAPWFSDIVKQVLKEVGDTNEFDDDDIGAGFDKKYHKNTLGITNILFINATCQSMVGDTGMQIRVNHKGRYGNLNNMQINPILYGPDWTSSGRSAGHWDDKLGGVVNMDLEDEMDDLGFDFNDKEIRLAPDGRYKTYQEFVRDYDGAVEWNAANQQLDDDEFLGGGKTRRRIKKRKDIRKRKKKTKNGRRKTRRKKRKNKKKRKQRKKNTRKKRGGGCENAMGIYYFRPDYDRCMKKMRNKNNKTSKTYCCAAAIKSRQEFIVRKGKRERNKERKAVIKDNIAGIEREEERKREREQRQHQNRLQAGREAKRSMRLWYEWEEKDKKKFYDSFKEERLELLKKQFNRLNTQQQTILNQQGVEAQIKIIVKQTKEFINQMNDYVATKLGGWSQGIQEQKNRWKTEQRQSFPRTTFEKHQQRQMDPQSYVNGLNQELEFLFNQLYNGIDEDILKEYAFVKALEEDIKIIKRQFQASGQNYIPAPGNTLIQQSINLRRMYPTFTQNLNMAFNNYPPSDDDDLSAFVAFNSIYPRNNNQSTNEHVRARGFAWYRSGGKRKTRRKKRKNRKN